MEIETVVEHCKHPDCVYRNGDGNKATCDYILYEKRPRGCKISECDKYRRAKRKKQRTDGFAFVYGIVEEDDEV